MNKTRISSNIIFYFLSIVFFYLFFKILSYIVEFFYTPVNQLSEVLAIFILVVIVIPLSVYSSEKVMKIIKNN